jgi:predicted RNA-binding Zn-ribbon protein involved in translation (DUF1610 family)
MILTRQGYPTSGAVSFKCPICGAQYRVVPAEAPPTHGHELLCLSCGGPLRNREGGFALKYFRVGDGANRE